MTDEKLAHLIKEKVDEIVTLAKENDLEYLTISIQTDDDDLYISFNNKYWESKRNVSYSSILGYQCYGNCKKEDNENDR